MKLKMDEFACINTFFKSWVKNRTDVVLGIGDDAACLNVPSDQHLLVSCDTLVAGVHFLDSWDAYDIAFKAAMVNISDIAAMGGEPCWITLALTLPVLDTAWLTRFAAGLRVALQQYNVALVGGDTTRGPMSITVTIHGVTPKDHAVKRSGAQVGDLIYVTGHLGAAALALSCVDRQMDPVDKEVLMQHLHRPVPRVDLKYMLRKHARSAIDISDGLLADLHHICIASNVGSCLRLSEIPVHPLVLRYDAQHALDLALHGGDDYEICLTVSAADNASWLNDVADAGLAVYPIGWIESSPGISAFDVHGDKYTLQARGYNHFGACNNAN